jgi:hypothetical protein
MRWGLNEGLPVRVTSAGGRYRYKDDWQTPDTQVLTFDFKDQKTMVWEGRSCNGLEEEEDGRGVIFFGENGAMKLLNTRYMVYDKDNKKIKEESDKTNTTSDSLAKTVGPGLAFDIHHLINFAESIRGKATLNSDVAEGYISTMFPLLGNIAFRVGRDINIDPLNGKIVNDPGAMKFWSRDYEPGWEPKL